MVNPTKLDLPHKETDWVENPKSIQVNKKRKAGAPSQSVVYFQLCQHMLLCW